MFNNLLHPWPRSPLPSERGPVLAGAWLCLVVVGLNLNCSNQDSGTELDSIGFMTGGAGAETGATPTGDSNTGGLISSGGSTATGGASPTAAAGTSSIAAGGTLGGGAGNPSPTQTSFGGATSAGGATTSAGGMTSQNAGQAGASPTNTGGISSGGSGGSSPSAEGGGQANAGGGSGGTAGTTDPMTDPMTETRWVGTWMTAPQLTEPGNLPPDPGLSGNTLRQIVLASISGARLRVSFSNEWGNAPVTFEAVHLARSMDGSAIDASSDQGLSFDGMASVTIPAGQTQTSDAFDFALPESTKLALTIRFGSVPSDVTGHPGSRTTSYLQTGDAATANNLSGAATTDHWYFITGIEVEGDADSAAVVTLGDSITDGRGSTTNGNDRWPDQLSRRLRAGANTAKVAALNAGIGGNAVVSGGLGPTALERFERDVLNQAGVRWVIVLEGVNDIGGSSDASVATGLIDAYGQLIDAAHAQGVLVYGVPILPFGGSDYDTPTHAEARETVNDWIRTSGSFDAVIDLDSAVRDPSSPLQLLPAYDTGDHLHLSPAGYQAMADAIDLSLFTP